VPNVHAPPRFFILADNFNKATAGAKILLRASDLLPKLPSERQTDDALSRDVNYDGSPKTKSNNAATPDS
jgi:hypothetical protein